MSELNLKKVVKVPPLHKSKIIRHFYEKDYPIKKTQKELDNIHKKIKRNRSYFYSAKDIAVLESLENDGIIIPKEIFTKNPLLKVQVILSLWIREGV